MPMEMNSIRSEWNTMKEKWFHGETMDPVFEGVVRDFCTFDEAMHGIQTKVQQFMKGVEQLASGMTALSDGVSAGLSHTSDHQIASDSCKLKEATNQIARADAPHSAIAKLRRDMMFNILNPVQSHIANNRNLKVSLDIRRRRLTELTSAKKQFDDCTKKNLTHTDKRYMQAQSNFEAAKSTFNEVDRHVFEWLYILEEYRGDILDSTLQTLKYLQYEFFATSAHAISISLPSRMEFRPMVEMTPDHLEVQVEMELQANEDDGDVAEGTGPAVADFSLRLIEKKAKEEPDEQAAPALPVDPLSLSSLLSQGFEEGPARRALRLHQNNTQAAMDWLIDGGTEDAASAKAAKALEDGVRMPTTVKRVQKLKAMRKAKQEKSKRRPSDDGERTPDAGRSPKKSAENGEDGERHRRRKDDSPSEKKSSPSEKKKSPVAKPQAPPMDLLEVGEAPAPVAQDLLGFDAETPAVPTDFSKPFEMAPLPDLAFDGGSRSEPPTGVQSFASTPPAAAGFSPDILAQVQALAQESQVSPQQLLLAAQQQAAQAAVAAAGGAAAGGYPSAPSQPHLGGLGGGQGALQSVMPSAASGGLAALDPFEGIGGSPEVSSLTTLNAGPPNARPGAPAASAKAEDQFSSLVGDMVS